MALEVACKANKWERAAVLIEEVAREYKRFADYATNAGLIREVLKTAGR